MSRPLRVLYSFPHPIGAPGIGSTAWYQVSGLQQNGVEVVLSTTSVARTFACTPPGPRSLTVAGRRVPHRVLGVNRSLAWHDRITGRWLRRHAGEVDAVHGWPSAFLATIRAARELGIPSFRESPNSHTRTAYELAAKEREKLGLESVPGMSHTPDPWRLVREEAEFAEADFVLVPSPFVERSFLERGHPAARLLRHHYGYDPERFQPGRNQAPDPSQRLEIVFLGTCEPRKGLHYILEAWRRCRAGQRARLRICGRYEPGYRERVQGLLDQPGIVEVGFVDDPASVLSHSHVLVLPTVEEGSALVTYEARAAGCLLLVSDASGACCTHGVEGLVHAAGDVDALTRHLRMLLDDPAMVRRLQAGAATDIESLTWTTAGARLAACYREGIERLRESARSVAAAPRAVREAITVGEGDR